MEILKWRAISAQKVLCSYDFAVFVFIAYESWVPKAVKLRLKLQ